MRDECPHGAKRSLREIEADISKTKEEIYEKYYQLGKSVCEIADNDAGKIGELVDRLVELKKEHIAQETKRRDKNEPQ